MRLYWFLKAHSHKYIQKIGTGEKVRYIYPDEFYAHKNLERGMLKLPIGTVVCGWLLEGYQGERFWSKIGTDLVVRDAGLIKEVGTHLIRMAIAHKPGMATMMMGLGKARSHKYISKKMVNGQWRYWYRQAPVEEPVKEVQNVKPPPGRYRLFEDMVAYSGGDKYTGPKPDLHNVHPREWGAESASYKSAPFNSFMDRPEPTVQMLEDPKTGKLWLVEVGHYHDGDPVWMQIIEPVGWRNQGGNEVKMASLRVPRGYHRGTIYPGERYAQDEQPIWGWEKRWDTHKQTVAAALARVDQAPAEAQTALRWLLGRALDAESQSNVRRGLEPNLVWKSFHPAARRLAGMVVRLGQPHPRGGSYSLHTPAGWLSVTTPVFKSDAYKFVLTLDPEGTWGIQKALMLQTRNVQRRGKVFQQGFWVLFGKNPRSEFIPVGALPKSEGRATPAEKVFVMKHQVGKSHVNKYILMAHRAAADGDRAGIAKWKKEFISQLGDGAEARWEEIAEDLEEVFQRPVTGKSYDTVAVARAQKVIEFAPDAKTGLDRILAFQRMTMGNVKPNIEDNRETAAIELEEALTHGDSGSDWYKAKIDKTRAILTGLYPSLTDDSHWKLFCSVLATTSPNMTVQLNMDQTLAIYEGWLKTGKLPLMAPSGLNWSGPTAPRALAQLQVVLNKSGIDGMASWLLEEVSGRELRRINPAVRGVRMDEMAPRSRAFGPKVGPFTANLLGDYSWATVDRWAVRAWRRWTNTQKRFFKKKTDKVTGEVEIEETPNDRLTSEEQRNVEALFQSLSEEFNMEVADVQAALWYYEKRLWDILGWEAKGGEDIGFDEAAQRSIDRSLGEGTPEKG